MTIEEKAEAYKQSLHPYVSCSERQAECGKIGYIKGYMDCLEENKELKEQIEKMENCWNCKFFKEKKYQACIDYKKNNTKCCAFYKWELAE